VKRFEFYISEDYLEYLKSRKDSSVAEHIRYALAQYIHRLRQEETKLAQNASASVSKRKEEE